MFMQLNTADQKLCTALIKAKTAAPEIIGLLHSAFHDGHRLADGEAAERIKNARLYAQAILLAIGEAELAITSAAPLVDANAVLEPFPGNGAFTA